MTMTVYVASTIRVMEPVAIVGMGMFPEACRSNALQLARTRMGIDQPTANDHKVARAFFLWSRQEAVRRMRMVPLNDRSGAWWARSTGVAMYKH